MVTILTVIWTDSIIRKTQRTIEPQRWRKLIIV